MKQKKNNTTKNVNDQIISSVKRLLDETRELRENYIKRGDIQPSFDCRDYADNHLIYGIRIIPIYRQKEVDYENFNLGSCLTYNTVIPTYKFFKFKDMYKTLCEVYDKCGLNFKKIPVENALTDVFNVLSNNSKYYKTIYGSKYSCRICIFIYAGSQYVHNLNTLAEKFRERDIEEAKAVSNYFNSKLVEACDRIMSSK